VSCALFDLDQTLLPYDTQALFCNYVLRREGWRRAYPAVFLPALPLRALHILSTRNLKRVFLSYLWKMPRPRLTELAHAFAEHEVPPLLYPDVASEIERHRKAGRTLILNTASPDIYANAIGRVLGFDHTIATRVRFSRDPLPLIPDIDGPNNKNDAKLKAMRHLMPVDLSLPLPGSWAYSDSKADLPMLRFVEHPVVVNPDPFLESVALEEHWEIMRPHRPQKNRLAFAIDTARQSLGLWTPPLTAA
jgi:HAD superfamily hydrolase (TIGR01490 family)